LALAGNTRTQLFAERAAAARWLASLAPARGRTQQSSAARDLSRSNLEEIGDRLEQVEAILAYAGAGSRRLGAARELLQAYKPETMPTRGRGETWVATIEAMLKLDRSPTDDQLRDLGRQIASLRGALHRYLSTFSR